ncbi:proline-rich protein PRCC [Amia ocellicauda]|uniref:proline-rich protein PRCC n=1 Tax=Amia ocellicauda TaxID=2972642 RepID=UPI0034639092
MSLVAYGSSDDSDEDAPPSGAKSAGLFSSLPAPKHVPSEVQKPPRSGPSVGLNLPPPRDSEFKVGGLHLPPPISSSLGPRVPHAYPGPDADEPGDKSLSSTLPQPAGALVFNLPKPKKRSEPVKITIPEIHRGDSDSDEDEPVKKKALSQGSGVGLSSLLPQPRNLISKDTMRPLVPHTLTKRQPEPKAPARPRPTTNATPAGGVSASPSAIKAAAKSATLQLARQMAQEEEEGSDDDDVAPENYFSLPNSSQVPLPSPESELESAAPVLPPPPGTEAPYQSDAPLDFGSAPRGYAGAGGAGTWEDQQPGGPYYSAYQESATQGPAPQGPGQEPYYQDYYSAGYYQESDPGLADAEEPGSSSMIDDEAFRRLQGKRNRGKEEVKFLEIKGDDQLSGSQQWLTKAITEEKEQRKSFSKKKGEGPTGQQRRKHQITYLIHQAKERELELKNNWADNKLTRRQTQAKYGF